MSLQKLVILTNSMLYFYLYSRLTIFFCLTLLSVYLLVIQFYSHSYAYDVFCRWPILDALHVSQ
jgi:hypothetical protein